MNFILEKFELSLGVEDDLDSLFAHGDITEVDAFTRCVTVAHDVMLELRAHRHFYKEGDTAALILPVPYQLPDPPMHMLQLNVPSFTHFSLTRVCQGYLIDRHSALAWGIACLQVLETALMTHRLFTDGKSGRRPVIIPWINGS